MARKGHICEDSLAYASYSSKDDMIANTDEFLDEVGSLNAYIITCDSCHLFISTRNVLS